MLPRLKEAVVKRDEREKCKNSVDGTLSKSDAADSKTARGDDSQSAQSESGDSSSGDGKSSGSKSSNLLPDLTQHEWNARNFIMSVDQQLQRDVELAATTVDACFLELGQRVTSAKFRKLLIY